MDETTEITETETERAERLQREAEEIAAVKAFDAAEVAAHLSEARALRDIARATALGAKSGKRLARKAFMARVEAYRNGSGRN